MNDAWHVLGGWCFMPDHIVWTTLGAGLTSFALVLLLGRPMIGFLSQRRWGQPVRDDGPQSHLNKSGTPTMGGVLMLSSLSVAMYVWLPPMTTTAGLWCVMLGFGGVGLFDDLMKLRQQTSRGLSACQKMSWMSLVTAILLWQMHHTPELGHHMMVVHVPFLQQSVWPLGGWCFLLGYLMVVGSSNAVNLTDGLDGLASLVVAMVAAALGIVAYHMMDAASASAMLTAWHTHLQILVVFAAALCGACIGFLWFNAHPAEVFMGDVGALALGALLGAMAWMMGQAFFLCVVGFVLVLETVSVMLQVISFKCVGRRIFKMAPLHHHFELCGWSETKVVCRFWILTMVCVVLGLAMTPWGM